MNSIAIKVNQKVRVSNDGERWYNRHLASLTVYGIWTYLDGETSWTTKDPMNLQYWKHWTLTSDTEEIVSPSGSDLIDSTKKYRCRDSRFEIVSPLYYNAGVETHPFTCAVKGISFTEWVTFDKFGKSFYRGNDLILAEPEHDQPIQVSSSLTGRWVVKHFYKMFNGHPLVYDKGRTSHSMEPDDVYVHWLYWKPLDK